MNCAGGGVWLLRDLTGKHVIEMASDQVLWNDKEQILCHQTILGKLPSSPSVKEAGYKLVMICFVEVGEGLRAQHDAVAEENKQRAIRSTEEVVRREEAEKREGALKEARERWAKERQELFVEAHQNQLRAIAKHTSILEEKLRSEFATKMKEVATGNKKRLEHTVEKTWLEAGDIRDEAVLQARAEEREKAVREAERVRETVSEEKAIERQQALLEKDQALMLQQTKLEEEKERALEKQRQELTAEMQSKLTALREECDQKFGEMEKTFKQQVAETELVRQELLRMAEQKADWESRHARLKQEFADFIDKVPGFRAEFVLQ